MKTKKRGGSVFAVLLTIVLIVIVAATLTANVLFSGENVPKVAGYYLYMHETEDMVPDIPQNSLVFAKEEPTKSLALGNKVLCYLSDGNLALRVIYNITVNETDGTTNYYPGTALDQGSELTIPRSNIFAICHWHSKPLYNFVTLATSVKGLLCLLVLPCVVLIIMLLAKIAGSSRDDMDDEEFLFDDEKPRSQRKKSRNNPLFDPEKTTIGNASHEMKKSSIMENFEKKEVDENSPYQKAVQERTMKFRIQQEQGDAAKHEALSPAKANSETQVFAAPGSEPAHKAAAPAPVQNVSAPAAPAVSAPSTAAPAAEPTPAAPRIPAPNIDDIVRPSELRAARDGKRINPDIAATDSIDDLLRVLEAEKKKL